MCHEVIHTLILKFLFLLLAFSVAISSSTLPFTIFKNSSIAYFHNNQGLVYRDLQNGVKSVPEKQKKQYVRDYLDSLGFFEQSWDSSATDSIIINPGIRSMIVSESVSCSQCSSLTDIYLHELPNYYDAGLIRNSVAKIGQMLVEKGYPFAQIVTVISKDSLQSNLPGHNISVVYKIKPDLQYRLSTALLQGDYSTRKKILLNDISLKKGDLFNVDKIQFSVNRLKSRAYISNAIAGTPHIDTAFGTDGYVAVPFLIEDRKGLGVEGAVGFNSGGDGKPAIFGNLTFSLINMLHSGESASLEYAGDQKYQKLSIEMSKPWVFNVPLEISGAGSLEIVAGQYGYIAATLRALTETNSLWKIGGAVTMHEITPSIDSLSLSVPTEEGSFYGVEFILKRNTAEYSKGILAHQFQIQTGSGFARKSKNYSRTHFEFNGSVHIPVLKNQAIMARAVSMHMMTKEDVLLPAEMYRVGGYNSIRGYADDEFPFRTAFYGQFEYRFYFKNAGAVYIFADGGTGFEKQIALNSSHRQLLGYGVGISLPSKFGGLVLEWARNYQDGRDLGRLHIRFQNSFISRGRTF